MSKKYYPFIDIMRIIASLLVIAIHTDPLTSFNPQLNFLITRIFGRLAVPFFFMTTAYFLFNQGMPTYAKLKSVIKQFLIIDICSILLYLPVQIYNHSLSFEPIVIVKDLFMDGTFYHLWYLPAVIIGLLILYELYQHLNEKTIFMIVCILYMIGLAGDSYYSYLHQIPLIEAFYTALFKICDYTRNGFLFAPIFLFLGAFLAQHQWHFKKYVLIFLMLVSFMIFFIETLLIHQQPIITHDAMTLSLPFISFFFFSFCLTFQSSKRFVLYKDLSLYVYILHPLMIIVVRMMGKLTHLEHIFISQSLFHYLAVTGFSFLIAYLLILLKKGGKIYGYHQKTKKLDRN
ncbi:acyltransferase [Longibaculum muris]|uniref:acyltransferase n=1 Tax=Longibaculum muris TaxID=1796628 RepID=UPI0012B6BE86|nr:acyltransferase family protein [Longibaculum muris]